MYLAKDAKDAKKPKVHPDRVEQNEQIPSRPEAEMHTGKRIYFLANLASSAREDLRSLS